MSQSSVSGVCTHTRAGSCAGTTQGLCVDLVAPVEDIGSVLMVRFDDPDGNPLMVCQRA